MDWSWDGEKMLNPLLQSHPVFLFHGVIGHNLTFVIRRSKGYMLKLRIRSIRLVISVTRIPYFSF